MIGLSFRCSAAAFALAACAPTVETAPVSEMLEPMEYRPYAVGEVLRWQTGDNVMETEVLEISDGMITLRDSEGCQWTTVAGAFAPSTEWSNCISSSGSHEVTREGNIFPLTVGSTETWHFTGTARDGDTWEGTRTCTVTEEVQVAVPAGTFDTYHVVCEDPWRVRHWYVAPEIQRPVMYTRSHKRRAESEHQELVAVELPAT